MMTSRLMAKTGRAMNSPNQPGRPVIGSGIQRRRAEGDDRQVDGAGHPPVAIEARGAGKFLEAEDRQQGDAAR